MENSQVLSHLSFPFAVSPPSSRNIQLSGDGQLFLLTRGAIHILTPEFNVDPTLFSSFNQQPSGTHESAKEVKWHTNRIQIDKTLYHNWALESDDWGTLSLGSLDVSWVGMALSPTNASKTHCCVVAALTSNLEVTLWSPLKNHISGEWQKIQDVTQIIKDSASFDTEVQRVLTTQVHCMAWSKGMVSSEHTLDESILALGNRAGSIICMKYLRGIGLSYITAIPVSNDWILDIVWSPWFQKEDGCYSAYICCSVADGSVYHIQVEVSQEVKIKFSDTVEPLHSADSIPTTALSLIQNRNHDLILVYTKPGVVHLQRISRYSQAGWDGLVTLALPIQPSLRKQNPFAAIAGIIYYSDEDLIQLYGSDGTVCKILDIMKSPKLSTDPKLLELSNEIQKFSFFKEDLEKVGTDDRIYISGVINYDNAGTLGWFYECRQPNDFSYKLDSQQISYFGLVQLEYDETLHSQHLSDHLSSDKEGSTFDSPSLKLRESLVYLDYALRDSKADLIWELLQKPLSATLDDQLMTFPKSSQGSLFLKLFQDPKLSLLRLKFTLANFLLRFNANHLLVRGFLDQVAQSIIHLYMRLILQHFQCMTPWRGDDLNFMLRWLILCHSKSEALQEEIMDIVAKFGSWEQIFSQKAKYCETCPACRVIIPINLEDEAVCENGHRWQRCSVTFFILAMPNARTCAGCRRKSLLPSSLKLPSDMGNQDWLPPGSRSQFMEDLLEAAHWCIHCGNRFVRFL